ncbi:hypothetical protein Glove_153g52 [Diversispora epigaea]|uniref:HMG box domain-containing protein n=1 Tax=Diversispora epigaea TaxID=1348612 RepID=A0A397ISM9_9GLOM|nr:hypothetical protein Glove_153g52 [Diversispora epigaea]
MPKATDSSSSLRDSKDFREILKNAIKKHLDVIKSQGVILKTNLPLEELLAPSKKTLKKVKKRAQNGFILYRKDNQSIVRQEYPHFSQPEISKKLQERWSVESFEIKNVYTILSSLDFLVHNELFGKKSDQNAKCSVIVPQMVLMPEGDKFYLQNIATAENFSPIKSKNDSLTTSTSISNENPAPSEFEKLITSEIYEPTFESTDFFYSLQQCAIAQEFNFSIPHIPQDTSSVISSPQNSYIPSVQIYENAIMPTFTQFSYDVNSASASQRIQYDQNGNWHWQL